MTKGKERVVNKKKLKALLNKNLESPEFVLYLDSCVSKWSKIKIELEIMDCIMDNICGIWKISKEDLVTSREQTVPRALMFYLIKKHIDNLSFELIGEMFSRQKSYVHKAFDEMTFAVERHKKSNIVKAVLVVQKALESKKQAGVLV